MCGHTFQIKPKRRFSRQRNPNVSSAICRACVVESSLSWGVGIIIFL